MGQRLSSGSLLELNAKYPRLAENRTERNVAVVAELNVPLAGFQDLIMVLLAGHHFFGRNVNHEHDLLQMLTHQLISIEPEFENFIHWGHFPQKLITSC